MTPKNFSDKEFFEVCLASLLHDIGKFAFRCLPEEELYGKQTGKRVTHEDLNRRVLRNVLEDLNFRSYWSKGSDIEASCVVLGDWISAQERDWLDEEDKLQPRGTPLKTIFSSIILEEKDEEGKVKELKIDERHWIHKNLSLSIPNEDDYTQKDFLFNTFLYEEFLSQLRKIGNKYDIELERDRMALFRELTDLLRKYCSYVPSAAYRSSPDIDLFNHSKMTCAITACLYKYYLENGDKESISKLRGIMGEFFVEQIKIENPSERDEKNRRKAEMLKKKKSDEFYTKKLFLLAKGDFSGIQNFVSTISTDKASAHLKARSFYLAHLNRLIPIYLVRELGLPETNIIYNSGGNFEILADNTDKTKEILKEKFKEINAHLLEKFGISIFLSLQYKEMSALDFDRQVFHQFIANTTDSDWKVECAPSKNRKFYGHDIFKIKGPKALCKICYNEIYENNANCKTCEQLENLRRHIKSLQTQTKGKLNPINENCKSLFNLGTDLPRMLLYDKNETKLNLIEGIYEILPLGLPLDNDKSIVELSELGKKAGNRTGENKIGGIKLDVDNLGSMFSKGLGENLTLSSFSRLSFDVSLFFEGVVTILREKEQYKDEIYLLYSGGDDTFVLGPWDRVLDFAKDLNNYFKIYVNHHPGITISAAYGIYDPKYPVKKIFENLEECLEKAKNVPGKSCITVFGIPIKWGYFKDFEKWNICFEDKKTEDIENKFSNIQELVKYFSREKSFEMLFKIASLYSTLVKKYVPRTFLMRSILLCMQMFDSMKNSNELDISPSWKMEYYLKRASLEDSLRNRLLKLWKDFYRKQIEGYPKEKNEIMMLVAAASKIAQLNSGGEMA